MEWSRHLDFPSDLDGLTRRSHRIFLGPTPNLNNLDCHYTVLAEGQTPHPPHVHDDEEIIIPIVGDVAIIRSDAAGWGETREEPGGFGRLVYHSPRLPHTIRAVGPGPAGYLILRWFSPAGAAEPEGAVKGRTYDFREALADAPPDAEDRARVDVFQGPTTALTRLHAHLSFARPGAGSSPHQDAHDVAIVVLEGAVETTTGRVDAPGVIFHPAGKTHFIRAVGDRPARYLAIEFDERS